MVSSKKNIGGWEEHTGFGGVEDWALTFFATVYVNSTFCHPLGLSEFALGNPAGD